MCLSISVRRSISCSQHLASINPFSHVDAPWYRHVLSCRCRVLCHARPYTSTHFVQAAASAAAHAHLMLMLLLVCSCSLASAPLLAFLVTCISPPLRSPPPFPLPASSSPVRPPLYPLPTACPPQHHPASINMLSPASPSLPTSQPAATPPAASPAPDMVSVPPPMVAGRCVIRVCCACATLVPPYRCC